MKENLNFFPNFSENISSELYSGRLEIEYMQCIDEGLDVEKYKNLFSAIEKLPCTREREELADVLFRIISDAGIRENYDFNEPSDYDGILALSEGSFVKKNYACSQIYEKVRGAWYGRIIGCLLGKTVEGIRCDEFYPFLKETDNFPLHRYIMSSDISEEIINKYKFNFRNRCYADKIEFMPVDDDTNYTVFYQYIIDKYGSDFTSENISDEWLRMQSYNTYFTAERVAYINFINGYKPPISALYKNPFREWIGAQIRGDYFGYINPGDPEAAAYMAYKDARISHIKNGIYGEMFVAAMISSAFTECEPINIIKSGLSQIPCTSRLYKEINAITELYLSSASWEECRDFIHSKWDDQLSHHWCHTISNAMIVAAALLYGKGNFGDSVCKAVEAGFDTDCNGATVGSVVGIMNGYSAIEDKWIVGFNDTVETYMHGFVTVSIDDLINKTIKHIGL